MPEERSIKPDWVDQLDKLEAKDLDKTASWERLQQKLSVKPKTTDKRIIWISSIAAASILFFSVLPLGKKTIKIDPPKPDLSQTRTKTPENILPETSIQNPDLSTTRVTNGINVPKKQATQIRRHDIKITKDNNNEESTPQSPIVIEKPETFIQPVISTEQPLAANKKFRVVHNNELSNSQQAPVVPELKPLIAKKNPIIFRSLLNPASAPTNTLSESTIKQTTIRKPILPFSSVSQKD